MLKFLALILILGAGVMYLLESEATTFPVLAAIFFLLWEILECLQSE